MFRSSLIILVLSLGIISCEEETTGPGGSSEPIFAEDTLDLSRFDTATFAGGCFWSIEASFEILNGVAATVSGYAGGKERNTTYKEVKAGKTGHAETVQIYYDPDQISYKELLDVFFTAHDPTQLNRQGPDLGPQYRSVVFYHDTLQRHLVLKLIRRREDQKAFSKAIVTEVVPYTHFYKAPEDQQDYVKFHPDKRYIRKVSMPKIRKVKEEHSDKLMGK